MRATKPKSRLIRTITFVASTWVVFFAIFSALTLLAGWFLYEVRPFHALERIAREQKQAQARENLGEFHSDLGDSLLNVGRVEQAQTEFEKALDIDPLNSNAQKGMVECDLYLSIQKIDALDTDPAVIDEKLRALIDKNPHKPRLSRLYAFQGDYFYYYNPGEAKQSYETAIALDKDKENAVAYSGLSVYYYEHGKFDKAEKTAMEAWKAAKWDTILETNYADALLANGHYEKASETYDDALTWDPLYIWAYHNAAATSRLTGDLEISQQYYERLINMLENKKLTSLNRNKGGYTFTTGGGDQDQEVYLYTPSEQQFYAYYGLALTLHLMGREEDAESYVNKAFDLPIDDYTKQEISRLMQYDIDKLQEEQKGLGSKAGDFRLKYL